MSIRNVKVMFKSYEECLAFIEAQRDDVKFAVHTSPVGNPLILSKKQFGDWVYVGTTGDYLRAYPYLSFDDVRKNLQLPIATDDNGDEVILPYLIIPKTE